MRLIPRDAEGIFKKIEYVAMQSIRLLRNASDQKDSLAKSQHIDF
jgi:hypothetical protein